MKGQVQAARGPNRQRCLRRPDLLVFDEADSIDFVRSLYERGIGAADADGSDAADADDV